MFNFLSCICWDPRMGFSHDSNKISPKFKLDKPYRITSPVPSIILKSVLEEAGKALLSGPWEVGKICHFLLSLIQASVAGVGS